MALAFIHVLPIRVYTFLVIVHPRPLSLSKGDRLRQAQPTGE